MSAASDNFINISRPCVTPYAELDAQQPRAQQCVHQGAMRLIAARSVSAPGTTYVAIPSLIGAPRTRTAQRAAAACHNRTLLGDWQRTVLAVSRMAAKRVQANDLRRRNRDRGDVRDSNRNCNAN
jgi:hypothetical protein